MDMKQITIATAGAVFCGLALFYGKNAEAGSCTKQGSSQSIAWIQSKYKNCGNCGTQKDSKGKTVYYCYCGDGCKTTATNSNQTATASNSKSCEKYGSHNSFEWIEKRQKNCKDCGIQIGSKNEVVYYCYCGEGCVANGGVDAKAVGGKKGIKEKIKSCAKKAVSLKPDVSVNATIAESALMGAGLGMSNPTQQKFAVCVTKEVVKKVKDKLKKAIKKIF